MTINHINRFGQAPNKTDYARELTLQTLNENVSTGTTILNATPIDVSDQEWISGSTNFDNLQSLTFLGVTDTNGIAVHDTNWDGGGVPHWQRLSNIDFNSSFTKINTDDLVDIGISSEIHLDAIANTGVTVINVTPIDVSDQEWITGSANRNSLITHTGLLDSINQLSFNTSIFEQTIFFRLGSTTSGSANLNIDFSGVTETNAGWVTPDDGLQYHLISYQIWIEDQALAADLYGGEPALTNGLNFYQQFTAGGPFVKYLTESVKTNAQWLWYVDPVISLVNFGAGNPEQVMRFTKKLHYPSPLAPNCEVGVTLHDDLSGLTGHRVSMTYRITIPSA
jgi:hypothetical protein